MKSNHLPFLVLLLLSCSQPKPAPEPNLTVEFENNFYPAPLRLNEEIIIHTAIRISYNEKHEQANWVAYKLQKAHLSGDEKRKDRFIPDPKVSTISAHPDDYKNSVYDRGHLAPAADFKWSARAMEESFYMSNISPQAPAFNRGIWKKLEDKVRSWADENEELFIVTGGVLNDTLKSIGIKNKVSVPVYFYKVLLDLKEPEKKAIAFIIENKGSALPLVNYAVTIDSVEKLTKINFFHLLDDRLERQLEAEIDVNKWFGN